jgi:hypothetical protein
MRVLHLITAAASAEASVALARAQMNEAEVVIMAPEDSRAIALAMDHAIPSVRLRPHQSNRHLRDAITVIDPDVVHIHGARSGDGAVPLSVFGHVPMVMELDRADFDASGTLYCQVRGIRLERAPQDQACVICRRPTPNGAPISLAQLPLGIDNIVMHGHGSATPDWYLALYRRRLAAPSREAARFRPSHAG